MLKNEGAATQRTMRSPISLYSTSTCKRRTQLQIELTLLFQYAGILYVLALNHTFSKSVRRDGEGAKQAMKKYV